MAYKAQNLSVIAYANGFTLWHYRTTKDTFAAIDTTGYFDEASEMLRVGDAMYVTDSTGTTAQVFVMSNQYNVVDVSNAIAATDTD